jgi:hypothetical protein
MATWTRQYTPGRAQKPRTLVLNPAHPLGRELVFATFFNQPGGVPSDVIQGLPCAVSGMIGTWTTGAAHTGSTPAPPPSRWGPGMTWAGGTTDDITYYTGAGPRMLGVNRDMTAVVCFRYATNTATSTYCPVMNVGDFLNIRRQISSTGLEVIYLRTNGDNYRNLATALPIGVDLSYAAVVRDDVLEAGYLDGNLHFSGSTFSFTGTADRPRYVRLGGNAAGQTTMDGTIYAALFYRRALGVDELKTLHECPWIMCYPTQRAT